MFKWKNNSTIRTLSEVQDDMIYTSRISSLEQKDIEHQFTRLFSTEDGKKVLAYLQYITFQRALGASAPNDQIRYQEGQRSLVAMIMRLVDRGRNK